MSPSSWFAVKSISNIRTRCLCTKQPDTTKLQATSAQGIDMKPAKPKRKEIVDPPEIPEPCPDEPLPGVPVPGFPDVTIPFTPDVPLPELPEIPIPVKPGTFPSKNLPGRPKPIFNEILPKWRAPVMPDLATLFNSPLALHKVAENYKAEYLMLTSQMEVASQTNNYFYKKCGLPEGSIIQPIEQRLISKLSKRSNDGSVNNLILAISELSPVQVVAILSLLQNQIWLISNMNKLSHGDLSVAMNKEELERLIRLAARLQREILHPERLGETWCLK